MDIAQENRTKEQNMRSACVYPLVKRCAAACLMCVVCAVILTTVSQKAYAAPLDTVQSLLQGDPQSFQIIVLLTAITFIPTMLIMLTGFTRIVIVLSILRNAIGLQNMPPNQVLVGLALFLTLFIMSPVIVQIKDVAYEPYVQGQIDEEQAIGLAMEPVRDYMLKQTYQSDLEYFVSASGTTADIQAADDIPDTALIPAYMTSEIKRGFQIGFFLYIPFIVIDMVVASVLMSMGMMMLPPTVISLPFKLLLFVLVDGWMLTVKTLIGSYG
jgi:flagellar biosynthetic protein FliP